MGGNFFFGGLYFDNKGNLRLNERPYLGTKMLGGASRGNFVFFDPENRLVAAQYVHGVLLEFSNEEWQYFYGKIKESFELANIAVYSENGAEYIFIEDKKVMITPENFKLIVPKGGLKGYEGHLSEFIKNFNHSILNSFRNWAGVTILTPSISLKSK